MCRQKKQKWTENAQARRERNRKSARESRLRKKNFVSNLEDKVGMERNCVGEGTRSRGKETENYY
jgi:bZIP transcription factor